MGRLAQTLYVSNSELIATELTWRLIVQRLRFLETSWSIARPTFFSFATTQRTSCFACGPSVLRRPAHLRAVSTTVIQHHENSASSRCASTKLSVSSAASDFAVSASCVTFQAPQGIQSRPPFLYSGLQLRASCFRHQMQKSGQAHLCGAQQPAQQPSLAARQPQCTHNLSLNRTFCSGPRLGYKILAQTQPAAKCRVALR